MSATLPNQPPGTLTPQSSDTVPTESQETPPTHPGTPWPLGTVLCHTGIHTPCPRGTALPMPTGNQPTSTQSAGTTPNRPMDFHPQLIRSTLFVQSTSVVVCAVYTYV